MAQNQEGRFAYTGLLLEILFTFSGMLSDEQVGFPLHYLFKVFYTELLMKLLQTRAVYRSKGFGRVVR